MNWKQLAAIAVGVALVAGVLRIPWQAPRPVTVWQQVRTNGFVAYVAAPSGKSVAFVICALPAVGVIAAVYLLRTRRVSG